MNDNLTERVVAALCGPVVGTDANGYRLHLTSEQAYTLAGALLPLIREREAAAWDEGLMWGRLYHLRPLGGPSGHAANPYIGNPEGVV